MMKDFRPLWIGSCQLTMLLNRVISFLDAKR